MVDAHTDIDFDLNEEVVPQDSISQQIDGVKTKIWWARKDLDWAACYCEEKIPYYEEKLFTLYAELDRLELIAEGGNILMDAEKKLEGLAKDVVQAADDMVTLLYEGEERSNDWMDCGMADGTYETYLDILALLGVAYEPYEGYGRNSFAPIVGDSAEERLQMFIETVIGWAISLEPSLEGEEDRPNDLMDCGEIDGAYQTCLSILSKLGVDYAASKNSDQLHEIAIPAVDALPDELAILDVEKTMIDVYVVQSSGEMRIHYLGYFYENDEGLRCHEYTGFDVPFSDAHAAGILNFEANNAEQLGGQQYVLDYDDLCREDMFETINAYFEDCMPVHLSKDMQFEDLPVGVYAISLNSKETLLSMSESLAEILPDARGRHDAAQQGKGSVRKDFEMV